MTWCVVRGVRVWDGISFPEPTDEELAEHGWEKSARRRPSPPEKTPGYYKKCLDCPQQIDPRRKRCAGCHHAARRTDTPLQWRPRDEVDEVAVQRALAGDMTLHLSRAERVLVCERWHARGGSMRQLSILTGWRTERYFKVPASAVASDLGRTG